MSILISKENYERLINLYKTDEDRVMNEMLEVFKNYLDMYKNKNNDDLENDINFLDNTKIVFTLMYEFYCTEDTFTELEKEKQSISDDNDEQKEDMEQIEIFLKDLTVLKKIIDKNNFTYETIETEKTRIERIGKFIEKTTKDMNELNQSMSDLTDSLERSVYTLEAIINNNNNDLPVTQPVSQ